MAKTGKPAKSAPKASRPRMKSYGVPESLKGVLPWSWAEERLTSSHNYWLTTVRPECAPHTMPVWGVWVDNAFYFSTSATSRKGRNLQQNSNCIVCNENAQEAVIVEGVARKLNDGEIPPQAFTHYKAKYKWELDPKLGPVHVVSPRTVFAMPEKQFPKAVTRWKFE